MANNFRHPRCPIDAGRELHRPPFDSDPADFWPRSRRPNLICRNLESGYCDVDKKMKIMETRILHPTVDNCLLFSQALALPKLLPNHKNPNFVFSPLSLRIGLSLAAAGSNAQTLRQFLSFLGSSTIQEAGHAAAKLLNNFQLARSNDGPCLSFANGIWADKSTPLLPSFKKTANSIYNAAAENVDFHNNEHEALAQVNAWIERSTNGRIKNLVPAQSPGMHTLVILANGLFFKGLWAEAFDESATLMDVFRIIHGRELKVVPFMTSYNKMHFLACFDGLKVLRLPYLKQGDGPSLSMLLYLPNERDGLKSLVKRTTWDPTFFDKHYPHDKVVVRLVKVPKFKISSTFDGADCLRSFGLTLPFSEREADFTQLASTPLSDQRRLRIGGVHHGACVEVEEKGTTASSATAVIFQRCGSSGPLRPPPPSLLEFVANRPFLFAIRDDETGAMLFLGHIADPSVE